MRQLFLYQTVYNSKSRKLDSLRPIPEDEKVDQEFLGPLLEQEVLEAYTNGLINKWTMEPRERYIFDSSPIEEDMRQNNLTVRTFLYL